MSQDRAEQFIHALRALEADREVEPLVELAADETQTSNVISPRVFEGAEGAREFWEAYRGHFAEIRSEFHTTIVNGDAVALEWTTRGESTRGEPDEYDGTSLISFGDGHVTRFRAYFDPAALGRQMQPDVT